MSRKETVRGKNLELRPSFEDPDTQSLWDAAVAARGKPGPIDPIDADNIARSYRGAQSLEDSGFELHSPLGTYPRGVNVRIGDQGHWASLTPNIRSSSWHVQGIHPDDPFIEHRADLDVDESHLGAALRVHVARPDFRKALGL